MASNKFLAGIAALACAASVQAAPIPVSTSVAVDSQLTTGAWKTIQVNVNSVLASLGLTSGAIGSGQLTVTGFSNAAYGYAGSNATGYVHSGTTTHYNSAACNAGNCNVVDNIYTNSTTRNYYDLSAETMWVKAGDAIGNDTSNWQESYTDFSTPAQDLRTGSARWGWTYWNSNSRNHYGSYSGDLNVTLDLDAKALADVIQDGILSLTVWSFTGKFDIKDVSLNLLAQEAPAPGAEVPVPASLLLTGLGLAALATARRRRQA